MPVEIRELVIRAVTTLEAEDAQGSPEDAEGSPEDAEGSPQVQTPPDDKDAIIQECVKQVLRILKKTKER